nr:helix-turn-helix transcriptional regulator [uncultured Treponema sp.]
MDYKAIGKRIKKFRKIAELTQEDLAEKISISPTHMSHIETGSTKLSLQVLVEISKALNVRTDDLLFNEKSISNKEIAELINRCDKKQLSLITPIIKSLLSNLGD